MNNERFWMLIWFIQFVAFWALMAKAYIHGCEI